MHKKDKVRGCYYDFCKQVWFEEEKLNIHYPVPK